MKGVFIFDPKMYTGIFDEAQVAEVERLAADSVPVISKEEIPQKKELLKDCEFVFTGWGAPHFDAALLEAMPKLKAVFYCAGSVKAILSDEFWEKGVRISSAWAANDIPVAEYTLAQILFSLKNGWAYVRDYHKNRHNTIGREVPGAYKKAVGLISLGMVARHLVKLLKSFDLTILAYDPFVKQEEAQRLGVKLVTLEQVFEQSDIVSLHTPLLPETTGMITGRMFTLMKQGATFINTSRGKVIKEDEMIAALRQRQDITALLDVTVDEPPHRDSGLWDLENVIITPHIAGSMGSECHRMSDYMIEDFRQYLKGEPLGHEITREREKILA